MIKEQEDVFWNTIKAFDELGILQNVIIIGSWAEYFYPPLFKTDFYPNLRTRDVDFFYSNINIPKGKVPLVQKLKDIGYVYDEVDGVSRFYKEDLLELEFLTRILGSGFEKRTLIKSLGIKTEGLRVINILADFLCQVEHKDLQGKTYTLNVPEPAAYVIQKILTNPDREPPEKKAKDIIAIKELVYHIKKSEYHSEKLKDVFDSLSVKQRKIIKTVCNENNIEL